MQFKITETLQKQSPAGCFARFVDVCKNSESRSPSLSILFNYFLRVSTTMTKKRYRSFLQTVLYMLTEGVPVL